MAEVSRGYMYIIREFAACVFVAMLVGVVVLVICGIGYLLKVGITMAVWMFRTMAIAYRTSISKPHAMRFSSNAMNIATAPALIADFPS
jgi:uncharacterized membrane protein